MTVLDKDWALNQLRHKRQAYIYMLGALALLNSASVETLRGNVVAIAEAGIFFGSQPGQRPSSGRRIDLGCLADERAHRTTDFDYSLDQFHRLIRRNVLSEAFETVKAYAKAQGISATFKGEPWYNFVRIVRNAVTHDFHWRINPADLAILPVLWGGKSITATMNDTDLTGDFLNPDLVYGLIEEMEAFVQAN